VIWIVVAIACVREEPTQLPDPCTIARAPAPGPLAAEVARALEDPLEVARLRIEEGHRTGDPGFYALAEQAAHCALARSPNDPEARRHLVHVAIQFHQFASAERDALTLATSTGAWTDWMLLGDAQMEQGKLAEAAVSYQRAMDQRPGLALYDRAAWLRWLTGDVDGAVALQERAVAAGSSADPEPYAWALTRLGWLRALRGEPAPEIDLALALLPDYPPALFARGRVRLHAGDAAAVDDLRRVGRTVEATRARAEVDSDVSVDAVAAQDPRGYATWLADRDPARAVKLLDRELEARRDAVTHMAHAYAVFRNGGDGSREARAALSTGCSEPRVLLQGGLVLGDRALIDRALSMGPGLLPSERVLGEAWSTAHTRR
jgi:tetratricopeptide (TPR) repeat protein